MIALIKHLKNYWQLAAVVIALLVVQAAADLKLPEYTSNIVDVGIQQGSIESSVPERIRAGQLEALLARMPEEDRVLVADAYVPSEEEAGILVLRREVDADWDKWLEKLEGALLVPELLVMTGTKDEAQLAGMEEAARQQMALQFVREEYEAQGVDLEALQMRYLREAGFRMLGLAFVIMVDMIAVGFLSARISASVGRDLRGQVFQRVMSFSNAEMDRFSTASLITRSTNDIQQVQMVSMMLLRMVCFAPIMGVGGFIKVMRTTPSMAWIIGIAVSGIVSMVVVLMAVAMPKFKKMQELVDQVNLVAREILTGLPVIRAFSREDHEEARFAGANGDLMRNSLFTGRVMNIMSPCMTLMMNGITVLIVWVGAQRIDMGRLQVGDMMAFITYTMQIVMAFLMLTMMSIMLPRAIVAAKRIDEVLKTETSVYEPAAPKCLTAGAGVVEFDHVHFRYPGAEEDALEDITFTAKPGETTAIIGSTGCGKTTLVRLVPRFYDVTGGQIRVDGVDIRDLRLQDLRELLGYVPQKGVLFSGTIGENLRFGCSEASDAVIEKAAKIAQAASFIEEKEDGYESRIAQGGTNVSGGQKQRLSIARAIAKEPKIYIFDDSFSALDYKTDAALRRALKEEVADATVIIVAQRISTILHAEQILVLDEGRIVGKGTHEELMASCEAYQQIARSQLSAAELGLEGGAAHE